MFADDQVVECDGGRTDENAEGIDGKRFHIEDGWLAVRFSGTEPLLRIYAEAATSEMVNRLLDWTMEYLGV